MFLLKLNPFTGSDDGAAVPRARTPNLKAWLAKRDTYKNTNTFQFLNLLKNHIEAGITGAWWGLGTVFLSKWCTCCAVDIMPGFTGDKNSTRPLVITSEI